jgi:hypothetical protein
MTMVDGNHDKIDRWTVLAAAAVLLTLLGVGVLAVASTYATREGRTLSGEWRPNQGEVGPLMQGEGISSPGDPLLARTSNRIRLLPNAANRRGRPRARGGRERTALSAPSRRTYCGTDT